MKYKRLVTEANKNKGSIPSSQYPQLVTHDQVAQNEGPPNTPLWRPFEEVEVDESIENISCKGNCEHIECHNRVENNNIDQNNPINDSNSQKVKCHNCKLDFNDKKSMMDHKRDSNHPSKRKCNNPNCQHTRCWYVHTTLVTPEVQRTEEPSRLTCTSCQNTFSDRNEVMHHRKREHPSNIMCKYFLTNTCRRSANQGALCWYRHEMLPTNAPPVANTAPFVATSASPSWNINFPPLPIMSSSSMVGLQQQMMTMIQQQKLQQEQQHQQHQQELNIVMTRMMNMNM